MVDICNNKGVLNAKEKAMDKFTTHQFAEETNAADTYEMQEQHRLVKQAKAAGREAGLSSYRTGAWFNDNPHVEGTELFNAWAEAFKQGKFESDQDHDDSYLDYMGE
tara:strand:- start:271 stop:591 length:321 start_codon:yes stop_codon:yes gene_type:complete